MNTMKSKRIIRLFAAAAVAGGMTAALPLHGFAAYEAREVGVYGDLDGSMSVDSTDVHILADYLRVPGKEISGEYADINHDGAVNAVDLTLIKRLVLTGAEREVKTELVEVEEKPIQAPIQELEPSLPSTGDVQVLMFTVNFPDCKFTEGYTTEQVWEMSFGPEDKSCSAYPLESISAYYERASYGRLHVHGDVFEYTAMNGIDYYVDNTDTLVEEVLGAFDAQLDYNKYDVSGDKEMDTLILALPGSADQDDWWPVSGGYYGRRRFDNVRASNLLIGGWSLSDREGFNNTWIHEMGHGMGLPDYYKYENYKQGDQFGLNGDAGWTMMDDAYGDMTCFDKLMYGWYNEDEVYVYDGTTHEFTLESSQKAPNCILIPLKSDEGYFSEYFMVEYVTHEGNNSTWWLFKEGGIRVLHCAAEKVEGYWGPEFKYSNYGKYYDTSNEKQRVLRLVNDGNGFFGDGDVVNSTFSNFMWYDAWGYSTVEPNLQITLTKTGDTFTVKID